jgi:hypothetical protein
MTVPKLSATDTVATGSDTVIALDPDLPSLVAVMVALPAATPVTTPLLETEAMVWSDDDHDTVRPDSAFPAASLTVAVRVCVPPSCNEAVGGSTLTVATGPGPGGVVEPGPASDDPHACNTTTRTNAIVRCNRDIEAGGQVDRFKNANR